METTHKINILQTLNAYHNCQKSGNAEWHDKHYQNIVSTLLDTLPHGSGIDADWSFDLTDKAIFCYNSYHLMDDAGYYCEWIDFNVKISANYRDMFGKLLFSISGRFGKHQDIKDYLYEIIAESLNEL